MSDVKKSYFTVSLDQVLSSEEDLLSEFCFSRGALGIAEDLDFAQEAGDFTPRTLPKEVTSLAVYFAQRPGPDFFLELKNRFPKVQPSLQENQNKDWLAEWKKGFHAFPLSSQFWVVPSWEKAPSEAKQVINMDPGLAFGTGTHETTQLAAQFLQENLPNKGEPLSLIDVGTGTGILAIMANKMGVPSITATDIDPLACEVALRNLEINQCSSVHVTEDPVEQINGTFQWVVANIIDGVLVEIQKELWRFILPGGYMVVTGIMKEREGYFLENFHIPAPYQVIERKEQGDWVGFLLGEKT